MSVNKQLIEDLVNEQLAKAIVTELMSKLTGQWNEVLNELVSTRQTQLKLTRQIEMLENQVGNFDVSLLKQQQINNAKFKLQQKEGRILDFLVHEFGIKAGEQ